jgi:N-methylhydantoinase A
MSDRVACRLGLDIGGTFTDIVLTLPDGSTTTRKVPSTPADYSIGIVDCLTRLLAEYELSGHLRV